MNYTEHKDNPKSFRALTGLTHIQFSHLLPYFEAAHDDYLSDYEMNGKRRANRRSFCIYKNSPLPDVAERLFLRLLELSKDGPLPVLFHDGTEGEISRPIDYDQQKEQYSGKKKRHTVKNAVIITVSCLILFVSQTVSGKTHDKKMADTMYSFSIPCTLYQDTGYQG